MSDCILQIAVPLSKYAGVCIKNLYIPSEYDTYRVPMPRAWNLSN